MNKIYALLGGACTGKDTVRRMLLQLHPELVEATSHTTRPMRATENGSEYYFIDVEEFASMYEAGEFIETRTYEVVGDKPGADWGKGKDVPLIAMAHGIPYVATASVGDLRDLEYKVQKAMSFHGARFIQILVPCPLGWGLSSNSTVTVARMAMETGFYPIYEAEYGKITSVRKIRQVQPVINYLKMQRRYAHLTGKKADPNVLARLQALCDANIKNFGLVEGTDVTGQPVAMQAYERSQAV